MGSLLPALAVAATFALGGNALAQQFPTKPITLVVPAGPGSSADIVARVVSNEMTRSLGLPIIVDDRPGAGGNLAAELVARAPADGHALLVASTSTHGINSALYNSLRFDPVADFAPITLMATSPNVLVVSSQSKMKTVADVVEAGKKKGLNYPSGGVGTLAAHRRRGVRHDDGSEAAASSLQVSPAGDERRSSR
jgi:tripartite-type tricarboxylate transporter receptor subunit TctC